MADRVQGTYQPSAVQNLWHAAGSAQTLTAAFVAGTEITVTRYNQLSLFITYTMALGEAGNSADLRLRFRKEGDANLYTESLGVFALGVYAAAVVRHRFTDAAGAGVANRFFYAIPIAADFLTLDALENGVAANFGTLLVQGILSIR